MATVLKKAAKKTTAKAASTGKEAGRWNGHKFVISPGLIRGFSGLQIKGSAELYGKDDETQGYVSRKGSNPTEVSFTIQLNAMTGCDVREEAMEFVREAKTGKRDYFYVGGKKLVAFLMMLTEAHVTEVEVTPSLKWVSAKVAVTMKQCMKTDKAPKNSSSSGGGSSSGGSSGGGGGSGAGSGGSAKTSVTSTPTTTTKKSGWLESKTYTDAKANLSTLKKSTSAGVKDANYYIGLAKETSQKKVSGTAVLGRNTISPNKSVNMYS